MLLESLRALILAGGEALQETCGLAAIAHEISLVRQGSLHFPAVAELTIKGGPIQVVHLGCDDKLAARLTRCPESGAATSGLETLTNHYLKYLVKRLEARNPRGTARHLGATPVELSSRGLRSFGIVLETGDGQLFILCEIPSRLEMEVAKGSDYLRAMEATYLPRDWGNRQAIEGRLGAENVVTFMRKVECDVAFEIPGPAGVCHMHHGVLLDHGTIDGVKGLKFCSDLADPSGAGLTRGDRVQVAVGVDDRSLNFTLTYLGEGTHTVVDLAEMPCMFFEPPEAIRIAQRRLAFRIPVGVEVPVELHGSHSSVDVSPWGDQDGDDEPLLHGVLGDLSFSGARIVVDKSVAGPLLEINRRVICNLHLPGLDGPVSVIGAVRRATSRLIDRNERQYEIGLEFLISQDEDRCALEQIRQFVLAQQRTRLAKRIFV